MESHSLQEDFKENPVVLASNSPNSPNAPDECSPGGQDSLSDECDIICSLMLMLGFSFNDGICTGTARTGIEEFFAGQLSDFAKMNEDLRAHSDLSTIAKKIIAAISALKGDPNQFTEEDEYFLGIYFRLTRIDIHHFPQMYKHLFDNKLIWQTDANSIFPVTSPASLREKGRIESIDEWPGMYSKEDISLYIPFLAETFRGYGKDIAFTLHNYDHTLALCYRHGSNTWDVIDSYTKDKIITLNLSIDDVVKHIQTNFFLDKSLLGFETTVYALLSLDETNAQSERVQIQTLSDQMRQSVPVTLTSAKAVDEYGMTLGYLAAEFGHLNVLEDIAKLQQTDSAINFNQILTNKKSLLHIACENGFARIVLFLLKQNVDITVKDIDGFTPVHSCVIAGQDNILEILLKAGANIEAATAAGDSLLHLAIHAKNFDTFCLLVKRGAKLDVANNSGVNLAHSAIIMNQIEMLKIILDKVNPQILFQEDADGFSPIAYAVRKGNVEILQFLSTRLSNFEFIVHDPKLKLMTCAEDAPNKEEVVKFLNSFSVPPNAMQTFGMFNQGGEGLDKTAAGPTRFKRTRL